MFEKADRIGGLLRYGIPDFKMEKHSSTAASSRWRPKASRSAPTRTSARTFRSTICASDFHAILLAGGAEQPRDLNVPGRELNGIHFAMDFLPQQNRRMRGDAVPDEILATGKHVVIIGGGDTGADCLGTCHRQKAASFTSSRSCPCRLASATPPRPGRSGR